jgi:hypothetical protein
VRRCRERVLRWVRLSVLVAAGFAVLGTIGFVVLRPAQPLAPVYQQPVGASVDAVTPNVITDYSEPESALASAR